MTNKDFYINGCSHCSGAELHDDDGRGLVYDKSWPNQAARLLGAKSIVNESAPGNSNPYIIQRTVEYVLNNLNKDLFVIVGFTGTDRMYIKHPAYETCNPYQRAILTPGVIGNASIADKRLTKEHYNMYKSLLLTDWGDWEQQQLRFLQEVYYLKTFLEDHKVPYFFVSSIFDVHKWRRENVPHNKWLFEKTMDLRTYHNMESNYYEMLKDKFDLMPKLHIGLEGQTYFANEVKNYIIEHELMSYKLKEKKK